MAALHREASCAGRVLCTQHCRGQRQGANGEPIPARHHLRSGPWLPCARLRTHLVTKKDLRWAQGQTLTHHTAAHEHVGSPWWGGGERHATC